MEIGFSSIYDIDKYKDMKVLILTGKYEVFKNIVIENIKELYIDRTEHNLSFELLSEFSDMEDDEGGRVLIFEDYLKSVEVPSLFGKWVGIIDLDTCSKKEREEFDKYITRPSKNGILIAISSEYKTYRKFLYTSRIKDSREIASVKLNFPNRTGLIEVVRKMFKSRGMDIGTEVASIFIYKLGTMYDNYGEYVDKICMNLGEGSKVTKEFVINQLKNINSFVFDEFLKVIADSIDNDKFVSRRAYKVYSALLYELGARKLWSNLKYRVDEMVEFRIYINKGLIPIKVRYSYEESIERIVREFGEDTSVRNLSKYRFKSLADIAKITSIRDWLAIRIMLGNISSYDDESCERALYTILHRKALNKNIIDSYIRNYSILDGGIEDDSEY